MQYTNRWAQQHGHVPPALTVIIPTYNRHESLLRVLGGLLHQRDVGANEFEVVLADDGSVDNTVEVVRDWAESVEMRVKLSFSAGNRGPAHARNRAIAISEGEILLMTGDDILPPPDFLSRHLRWHRAHPEDESALLGCVVWPEDLPPTPFMRWMEGRGRAFYFGYPEAAGAVSPDLFYTCNVSVKRALVSRCGGFREDFSFASHEDLEMGVRLAETGGMRLYYDPDLKGIHAHILTPESSVRRVYLNGYSSVLYWKRVADRSCRWRRGARLLCRSVASRIPYRLLRRMAPVMPRCGWYVMLQLAYWRGASDAARDSRAAPSA